MTLFRSFFLAGFEASTHRRADGVRLDLVESTHHDELAEADYRRMLELGIATAREGTAWHRIEARPGRFDFGSVLNRIRVAERLGVHVIWDLCHFGWPDDVDPFAADFPDRLARYATAFARVLADESDAVPWYAPVNEISFVSWAAGDVAYLNPFQRGRGGEIKRQLVRAALAASGAVRAVDPRARLAHLDPIIHIEPNPDVPESAANTINHNAGQFEAWDMIAGRRDPELGGAPEFLDVIGVNFYDRNQWMDLGETLTRDHPLYRPLRRLLADVSQRYGRPLFIAETGTEADGRVEWLRYVSEEVAAAIDEGTPVEGVCIYPIVEHPGWDNDRQVPVGLWGYPNATGNRPLYEPLAAELRRQQARLEPMAGLAHGALAGGARR